VTSSDAVFVVFSVFIEPLTETIDLDQAPKQGAPKNSVMCCFGSSRLASIVDQRQRTRF
jgi:hypothetical protein